MKQLNITKTEQKKNRVYGIIGMVGLFFVGAIFGYIINGSDHVNKSGMSELQCKRISEAIISETNKYEPDADVIAQLNKVYSMNCLNREFGQPKPQPQPKVEESKLPETTCGKIEMLLNEQVRPAGSMNPEDHIDNAKIYANLSERGCPENSGKYKNLAKQELEIARALDDDKLEDKQDSIEIVETYKRLQMQAEAERMIEKAKRLTNPAIDFIIQLEKIIEE